MISCVGGCALIVGCDPTGLRLALSEIRSRETPDLACLVGLMPSIALDTLESPFPPQKGSLAKKKENEEKRKSFLGVESVPHTGLWDVSLGSEVAAAGVHWVPSGFCIAADAHFTEWRHGLLAHFLQ